MIFGLAVINPGWVISILSPGLAYGCAFSGDRLYTMPNVISSTSDPEIFTGLYTGVPSGCKTALDRSLSLMMNWVQYTMYLVLWPKFH